MSSDDPVTSASEVEVPSVPAPVTDTEVEVEDAELEGPFDTAEDELEGREGFEDLLSYLKDGRGFDFTGYKRTSLSRRVRKRMGEVDIDSFTEYLDHIQAHPDEVADLFDTILINVTAFRRDPEHWDHLREEVLPKIIEQAGDGPIRAWSAGCSTGEEAYTLAMEFCELLGLATFKERVKIYATDIDNDALERARRGHYEPRHLEDLPEGWAEKYFDSNGSRREFRRDVRRSVIFGRHDIVQDAPISRIDLLICRNLLMYFTPDTQTRILSRLHFGLKDDGYLFLGRAEMLLTRSRLFTPVDLQHRMFSKSPDTVGSRPPPAAGSKLTLPEVQTRSIRLRELTFATTPLAQVVLDQSRVVTLINGVARDMFKLTPDMIGRPFSDLDLSYRPVELRGHLDEANRENRRIQLSNVARVDDQGQVQHLDISIAPLRDATGVTVGMLLSFEDVSAFERLRSDLQRSNHDLETAYEELQSTNEELLTTNEELQSTVEELETTNEELQSTNEELQSTNEELETMNEELQSSNLEQEEVNNELNTRTRELDRANEFLRTILGAMDSGVVVVDDDLRVRTWDATSADIWGLRPEEVLGQPFSEIDCGLPTDQLVTAVEDAVGAGRETHRELPAVNRVGRHVTCAVHVVPLQRPGSPQGAILIVQVTPAEG